MKVKQKCVNDIRSLLVEEPTVIYQQQSVSELLKYFFMDQRTRHVYVVNEDGVMVGSVRLNDLIELIMEYLQNLDDRVFNKFIALFVNKTVADVMLKRFVFLKEDTSITDMLSIMLENKVNELPVLDDNNKVVGEANFMEFIKFLSDNEYLVETAK